VIKQSITPPSLQLNSIDIARESIIN